MPIIEAVQSNKPSNDEALNDAIAATAKPKTAKRSAKSKFYDGDLASLPVKGDLSLSSLFGSIPKEYKETYKAGFNQSNIKKDTAIPYIEAYRQSLTQ